MSAKEIAAIKVLNEKGEETVAKVKVKRYFPGKAPEMAKERDEDDFVLTSAAKGKGKATAAAAAATEESTSSTSSSGRHGGRWDSSSSSGAAASVERLVETWSFNFNFGYSLFLLTPFSSLFLVLTAGCRD